MTDPVSPTGYRWFNPDPRGVIYPRELRVRRSLRKSMAHMTITTDTDFPAVLAACDDPGREGSWMDDRLRECYLELFDIGLAHSVEVRTLDGELIGGLFGVSVGSFFAGESMFHTQRDASKAALVALAALVSNAPDALIDTQWLTDHLATMGGRSIPQKAYVRQLRVAWSHPRIDFDLKSPTPARKFCDPF